MEEPLMTYALWGSGALTPENAKAVLDTYVPENVGTVYRPIEAGRDKPGLRNALDWFESPDFLGEGGAVPSDDLIASLLYEREGPWDTDRIGDDVFLLALWPETPSHEDFDFIEAVQAAGILVIDLSRAWDELDLSLYSRPAPTKEEKAEARAEAREEAKSGRSRGRKLSESTETPETEAEEVVVTTPATTSSMAPVLPVVEAAEAIVSAQWLADNMFASIKAYIDDQIQRGIANALAVVEMGQAEHSEDVRPPFDPPYVGVDTKPYYMQKSTGRFRPADGKPRRGEEVHNLTDEEAHEKGLL